MMTPLLLCVGLAAPSLQDITERDRAVAQVVHDSVRLRAGRGAPSDADVLRLRSGLGDDDPDSYRFVSENGARDDAGRRMRWDVKVTFLAEDWTPNPEDEARWSARFRETDPETGAALHFHGVDDRSRTTFVTARVVRGNTRILLRDARSGGLTFEAHLPLALARLRFFVKRAEEEGLFDAEPRLVVTVDGEEVTDGDVVSVDHPLDEALDLALAAWLDDYDLPPEDGPRVVLELDDAGAREVELRAGRDVGPRLERTLDRATPSLDATARFRPLDPAPGEPIGQVAVLTVSAPNAAPPVLPLRITLHRTTWTPVLRRFEVRQLVKPREGLETDGEAELEAEVGGGEPALTTLERVVARGIELNGWRYHAASMAAAWTSLADAARIRPSLDEGGPGGVIHANGRPFDDADPVIVGWRLEPATLSDFATADVELNEVATLGAWTERVHQEVVYDLWIARDPTPPGARFLDDLAEGLDDDEGIWDDDEEQPEAPTSLELDAAGVPSDPVLRDQYLVREHIYLTDYELSLALIQDEGVRVPEGRLEAIPDEEQRAYAEALSAALRRPAGAGDQVWPLLTVENPTLRLNEYRTEFPILGDTALPFVIRNEGVYEVRLQMGFRREGERETKRVDVAIRINVNDQAFVPRLLDFRTRRAR